MTEKPWGGVVRPIGEREMMSASEQKRRGRKPNAQAPAAGEQPEMTTDEAPEIESSAEKQPNPAAGGQKSDDGPGVYECIKECVGTRTYRPGDRRHFNFHPGRNHFVKVSDK